MNMSLKIFTSKAMMMDDPTLWWLVAGGLIVTELLTGTFYLLMLSLGAVAAALAAYVGVSVAWQIVTAAAVGVVQLPCCGT